MQLEEVNSLGESESVEDMKLTEIRRVTEQDHELFGSVMNCIQNGWPLKREEVPGNARPYYNSRHELSVQKGILFKGDRIVIPNSLRKAMLKQIHASHIGVEGRLRRARESMYCPGMNGAVKDVLHSLCYTQT